MPEHGRLKEMFQCMFATEERPQALLTENSGASHGQDSRSTGQLRRNETLDAAILVDSHFEVSDPCFFALGKLAVRGE